MTTEPLTCPYCNASIQFSAGLSPGQRIVCPRCGDSFPWRPAEAFTGQSAALLRETAITDSSPAARSTTPVLDPALRSPRSLGRFAAVVVAVMLLMAGIGLTFMLMTQQQRRAYDTSRPPRRPGKQRGFADVEEPALVNRVSPDKLEALRYLPSRVNVLVAARIPELQRSPVGQKLLRDPLKIAGSEHRLEELPAWVGLRLEEVDHLVFAVRIDETPPPIYLVLRTTHPFDEEQLRERLKDKRVAGGGKKKLYSFRLPHKDVRPFVWLADDHTLIVSLFEDDLLSLPDQPAEDLQRLPDAIRTVLRERREPVSPVWIIGHSSDWTKTLVGTLLSGKKKEERERLASLRTFAIWLVPDNSLEVKAVVQCEDAMAAQRLEEFFRTRRDPDPRFKTALDDSWLTMQFPGEPDFLSHLLKR